MNKKYTIIGVVTVAVLALAYFSSRTVISRDSGPKHGEKLMPELARNIDNVGTVIMRSKGRSFKLHRENGAWVMPNKYNYPVGIEKVRDLVQNSANVEIIEKKTSDPKNFPELGLDDPEKADSNAIRIVLMSEDEKTVYADYIRGINRKGVNGTLPDEIYARQFKDNQAYLVKAQLNFDLSAHTLLNGDAFAIKYDKFKSISFNYPDNTLDNFTLSKNVPTDMDFSITEPKGKTLKAFAKANAIGTSLEYMSLEDIVPAKAVADKKPALEIIYVTFNGLTVKVNLYKNNNDNYLTFAASADEKNTQAKADADKINTLAEKWVYKVDFKSTGGFYYKLNDLLKE